MVTRVPWWGGANNARRIPKTQNPQPSTLNPKPLDPRGSGLRRLGFEAAYLRPCVLVLGLTDLLLTRPHARQAIYNY